MKIAICSDIHGNAAALTAVLADIDRRNPDLIFCGGDLAGYGAFPNEVIEIIRARHIPAIMGNYDDGVGFNRDDCGCAYKNEKSRELGRLSLAWTKEKVAPANKAYLRGLLSRLEFEAYGRKVLLVHGSPRKINEYLFADRPETSIQRLFEAHPVDIIICGHTHLPYIREIGDKLLLNTGSAGKPKDGDPRAGYLLLELTESEVKPEFIRVAYDVESAAQAIEASGLPSEFAAALRNGE